MAATGRVNGMIIRHQFQPTAPIESGGFEQRFWQLCDELAVHKDVKCTAKERRTMSGNSVSTQPKLRKRMNSGIIDLSRKHHGGEHEQEGLLTT